MKDVVLTRTMMAVMVVTGLMFVSWAGGHCQVPCGIYGDQARLDLISEHLDTIAKSIKQIELYAESDKPNYNQVVRWVANKDKHADEIAQIVTSYFMAQRIKPAAEGSQAHARYVKELTLLHQLLVSSMKTKQTTDLAHVEACRKHLDTFSHSYLNPS